MENKIGTLLIIKTKKEMEKLLKGSPLLITKGFLSKKGSNIIKCRESGEEFIISKIRKNNKNWLKIVRN